MLTALVRYAKACGIELPNFCDHCEGLASEHEWEEQREKYGEDADGNRGVWCTYERCRKCGDER